MPEVPALLPEPGAMPCGAIGLIPEAVLAGIAGTTAGGRPVEEAPELPLGLPVIPPLVLPPEACATCVEVSEREVAMVAAWVRREVATAGALRVVSMPVPMVLSAAAGRLQAAAVVISKAAGMVRKLRVFMRKTSSSS